MQGDQEGNYRVAHEKDDIILEWDGENGQFWNNSDVRTYMTFW